MVKLKYSRSEVIDMLRDAVRVQGYEDFNNEDMCYNLAIQYAIRLLEER